MRAIRVHGREDMRAEDVTTPEASPGQVRLLPAGVSVRDAALAEPPAVALHAINVAGGVALGFRAIRRAGVVASGGRGVRRTQADRAGHPGVQGGAVPRLFPLPRRDGRRAGPARARPRRRPDMEDVLVSPHTGALNPAEDEIIAGMFADNTRRLLDGEGLVNRIDRVNLYCVTRAAEGPRRSTDM